MFRDWIRLAGRALMLFGALALVLSTSPMARTSGDLDPSLAASIGNPPCDAHGAAPDRAPPHQAACCMTLCCMAPAPIGEARSAPATFAFVPLRPRLHRALTGRATAPDTPPPRIA